VASRYGLDPGATTESLLDFEARGWVRQLSFAGSSGWSLTEAGQIENERRLAAELDRAGARDAVTRAHRAFLPVNERLGVACTNWQIRPTPADPMAFNDHTDWRWDDRDSCHLVWLQFHEDLLATLGISRGSELTPLEDA
jgi:hypothetical protein